MAIGDPQPCEICGRYLCNIHLRILQKDIYNQTVFIKKEERMSDTIEQYDEIIAECRELMVKKNVDYGDSWRVMRGTSITDQVLVKVNRIIELEYLHAAGESSKVSEGIRSEFRDILNYCAFAIIKHDEAQVVQVEGTDIMNAEEYCFLVDIRFNGFAIGDPLLGVKSVYMERFIEHGYCYETNDMYQITKNGKAAIKRYESLK